MPWTRVTADERLSEWERSDGHATIRLRQQPDDSWSVRFDRLHQAPDGSAYRRETVQTREAATELVAEWQSAFDVKEQ